MPKPKIDLSEFYKYSRPKKPPCRVGWAVSQLSEEEQTQLHAALSVDKGIITAGAIIQWLSARGHNVTVSAVSSHRAGTCTCKEDS